MSNVVALEDRDTVRKIDEVSDLYAECRKRFGTDSWNGHPMQVECARKLFELWPNIQVPLKLWNQ